MPVMNRNYNRSDRPGLGLGPCGAGQARGRNTDGPGFGRSGRGLRNNSGRGMGQGMGRGMGRGGICRFAGMNRFEDQRYESELENRILELEEENRRLREAAGR